MKPELERRLTAIETALAETVPKAVTGLWTEEVAAGLRTPLNDGFLNKINAPSLELLNRGGKRWRPLVLELVYEICGGKKTSAGPAIRDLSALVELPHNGSLIIDDIEDKAEERRGGPAIHLQFGTDISINAGNFLYFLPTFVLDRPEWPETVRARILRYYLRTMRRLHIGQGLDIQWHNDHEFLPDTESYLQMCRFKTGALSGLSAEIGAAAAGASKETLEALGEVWEDIGVGFQIMDDVQNLTTGNPGKRRGDDLIEGKKSLPVLIHCSQSLEQKKALMDQMRSITAQGNKVSDQDLAAAIALMEASGALKAAANMAEELLDTAWKKMESLCTPSEPRNLLEDMVQGFVKSLK